MPTVSVGQENAFGYLNLQGEQVIPPQFVRGEPFQNGLAAVTLSDGSNGLIDKEGNLLLQSTGTISRQDWADGVQYLVYETQDWTGNTVTAVYDQALRPVDSPMVGKEVHMAGEGWCWYQEDGATVFVRGTQMKTVQMEGTPILVSGENVIFNRAAEGALDDCALVTMDGTVLVPYGTYPFLYFAHDPVTGLPYLCGEQLENGDPMAERTVSVLSMDGSRLASCKKHETVSMAGGRLLFDTDEFVGLKDLEGNWLYYQPVNVNPA